MASTSLAPLPRPAAVVLPSIRDMFPEYVLPRTGPTAKKPANASLHPPRSHPHPSFSFDVLKSHPTTSSLYHIASSRPRSKRPRHASPTDSDADSTAEAEFMPSPKLPRTTRSSTAGSSSTRSARRSPPSSSSGSSDAETEPDPEVNATSNLDVEVDVDADHEDGVGEHDGAAESVLEEEGKRHACPTCGKRFNRPSSLRIHVNTHTGAMPFRCPHPSCGRAFNVNSNMRRHYRNHCTNASSVMTHQYTSSLLTLSPSPASLSSTRTTPSSSPHPPPSTLSFHVKPSSTNSTTMLIQTSFTKSSIPSSPNASIKAAPPLSAVDSDAGSSSSSSSSSSSYSDSAVSSPITPASALTSGCSLRFLPNPAPDTSLERSPERWGVTPIDFSKWKNDELLVQAKAKAEEQLEGRDGMAADSGGESRVERSSPSPERSPYLESDVRSAR